MKTVQVRLVAPCIYSLVAAQLRISYRSGRCRLVLEDRASFAECLCNTHQRLAAYGVLIFGLFRRKQGMPCAAPIRTRRAGKMLPLFQILPSTFGLPLSVINRSSHRSLPIAPIVVDWG